ncbi:hypothetical protein VLK31_13670 [Variovorax sp. H27-G14]|uniref:S10 family serine carboxypeptidase-like protein n=1 Tax=Variovorax sp. H27-G14 TaxID=3111914 RepID=UPI0038FCF1AB
MTIFSRDGSNALLLGLCASCLCVLTACGGGGDAAPPVLLPEPVTAAAVDSPLPPLAEDKPYANNRQYDMRAEGNASEHGEEAAVTHKRIKVDGKNRTYTATVGHLVVRNKSSNAPEAAIFYTAYALDGEQPGKRPVTFIFNGGPGSSSTFLHMGSFAPKRVFTLSGKTVTGPADVRFGDNPETLLDRTDLVFMDPVGVGYSIAIAPLANKSFWGVDADNRSLSAFIGRYVKVNDRGQSPVFLYGESYGGPRAAMMSYVLQANHDIKLSGLVLQAPALNFYENRVAGFTGEYRRSPRPMFTLPTIAATARYHGLLKDPVLAEKSMPDVFAAVNDFIFGPLFDVQKKWKVDFSSNAETETLFTKDAGIFIPELKKYTGDAKIWGVGSVGVSVDDGAGFNSPLVFAHVLNGPLNRVMAFNLMPGKTLGLYDTRKVMSGPSPKPSEDYLIYDPSMNDLRAYGLILNSYVYHDLKYTAVSDYVGIGTSINPAWNIETTYPDKTKLKFPDSTIHLSKAMLLNPAMKVFTMAGYYDAIVTAAHIQWDMMSVFEVVPKEQMDKNYTHENYEGGHMIYADDQARISLRKKLDKFYIDAQKPPVPSM